MKPWCGGRGATLCAIILMKAKLYTLLFIKVEGHHTPGEV